MAMYRMAIPTVTIPMLPDFTRLAWTSDAAHQVWQPRLALVSRMWMDLEVLSVIQGLRPSALLNVAPEDLPARTREVAAYGLALVPLDREAAPAGAAYAAGAAPAPLDGPWSYRAAVCRADLSAAWLDAWSRRDDPAIGRLLGFPPCCVQFFGTTWGQGQVDPTWLTGGFDVDPDGLEADIAPGGLNILLRWIGVRQVFHLPCDVHCAESLLMAERLAALARTAYPQPSADHREILSWPVEWTALHGIAQVKTPILKVSTRTDYTSTQQTVRWTGTTYPAEGASGNAFPYRRAVHTQPLTLHRSFAEAFSPAENGFPSFESMETAHQMVLDTLVASPPEDTLMDLGCGNGALLLKALALFPSLNICGVEAEAQKCRYPWINHLRIEDDIKKTGIGHCEDTIIVSERRLEEIAGLEAWCKAHARQVLRYSYDLPQFARMEPGLLC